ncbi:cytochrome P450 [Runella slithyformis]|uniref:Unspecific monooxygenase n=1 Tax=Runella slithyformis (strain ATCC 29530 / DSM 19594 / LMG 11500 / NCIMB 11436 / LSU 4) TaxID=761193 RepID=A0A7U4E4H7_RUNSL|nr:cytochrome P450 [Runella slithyformis]AEI47158.1 Unspecific monooxygenase [Runella slithyformis DSM 19594]
MKYSKSGVSTIPQAKKNPFFGNTPDFVRNPLRFLEKMQKEFGHVGVVKLSLVNRDFFLVLTPEDTKHVLQENNRNYHKSEAYKVLAIFLGNGLLTSEGDFWRRQRKLTQPAFYKQRLALMVEMMNREVATAVEGWERKNGEEAFDTTEEMLNLTLKIVTRALFSTDVKHRLGGISESLNEIMHFADSTLKSFIRLPLTVPTPRNLRFKRAVAKVEAVIYSIIEGRREEIKQNAHVRYNDLLDMLIHTRDEETGETMTDQQVRDEVTTIFMAGHETTANALSWALYLLSKHRDVLHKLREEVKMVLGEEGMPTFETIRELKYTLQVVQEVMRLYPPAWVMGRKALGDDQLSGYSIAAGTYLLLPIYLLHRDPKYWQKPNEFYPDHFLPENIKARPTYSYIPFGGGPRMCVGNNFALMEMQIVLALWVRRLDFTLIDQKAMEADPLVTLRPKKSLKMYVKAFRQT